MPSSSTNYSYDIPTVGSDSTTYGTIINQFVESLSTKLKTVSDKINTAGVGASSTLAQVNRNIAQVDAINSRIPVGVADLLPDPYSGATTPVSTWPYLNSELQAEGFSPPTTAQEVIDFDYSGFAAYLSTRFDSLSARIVGLDAPITIADSSKLICETNKILDALGTTKTVTTTTVSNLASSASFFTISGMRMFYGIDSPFPNSPTQIYASNNQTFKNALVTEGVGTNLYSYQNIYGDKYEVTVRAMDVATAISNGDPIDAGIYLQTTLKDQFVTVELGRKYNLGLSGNTAPWFLNLKNESSLRSWGSTGTNPEIITLNFVKVTNSNSTVTTSTQVPVTIDDIDFSDCQ